MTIRVHSYVDGVCTSCGAVRSNDHLGPSWCSGRPTARAEANTLREQVERLTRERDEARAEVERFRDGCERASIVGIAMRGEIDDLRAENARQKRDIRVLHASNDAKLEQWRRAERDLADAHALLRECHRELATIEAITVSPSDTDGLLDLVRRVARAEVARMRAALEAK